MAVGPLDIGEYPSPNYAEYPGRSADFGGIVLHSTEGGLTGSLQILTTPAGANSVSAHFVIGEGGGIYRLVDPKHVAYHVAAWGNDPSLNRNRPEWLPPYRGQFSAVNASTVGIELVGFAARGFRPIQYQALGLLCARLCREWGLPPTILPEHGAGARIVTHAWLQTNRSDPGALFDWALFKHHLRAYLKEGGEDMAIVDELNKQVADLRREIEGLTARAQDAEYWRDQYAGQNQTRQEQIDALREEVAARNADVTRLSEALAAVPTQQRSLRRATFEYTDGSVQVAEIKAA